MDKEKNKQMDTYKLIFDHFKLMEGRYHTWMNYYSIFNGALFVAYTTILVSTGKVVEMEGNVSYPGMIDLGSKLFYLSCTYWDILSLIAFLGVIAGYCWFLSIVGHRSWLDNWRMILKNEGNMPFDRILYAKKCNDEKYLVHFHSTYKITMVFIVFVLFAWISILGYSLLDHCFSCCLFGGSVCLCAALVLLENVFHYFTGSDVSVFDVNRDKSKETATDTNKSMGSCRCFIIAVSFLLLLSGITIWCCTSKQKFSDISCQTEFGTQEINKDKP